MQRRLYALDMAVAARPSVHLPVQATGGDGARCDSNGCCDLILLQACDCSKAPHIDTHLNV